MMKETPVPFLDRALALVAPGLALRRYGARMMLSALSSGERTDEDTLSGQRMFEAVWGSRFKGDWANITQDADASNVLSLQRLRNNIRDHSHRTGIVAGPLKRITNNVVGHGIRPQARVKADGPYDAPETPSPSQITEEIAARFNYQAEKRWRTFVKQSDSTLKQSFYEQSSLAFRAMIADGEVLAVQRSSARPGRLIPLCIELIEIDRLWTPPAEVSNPKVRWGIEHDDEGVPVRYFVLKRHPGTLGPQPVSFSDYETIEAFAPNGAKKVHHLFDILRPGQSRGYTPFAAGLTEIQDLARFREAHIVAARVGACLAAFVKKPANAYGSFANNPINSQGQRITKFEPGMIQYLNPGEEVTAFSPNAPNTGFGEFTKAILQQAANAADIPYEVFANDFSGLNYSNARTVLLQAYLAFRLYQFYLINHLCAPVWESFVDECVAHGLITAPGYGTRREDYLRTGWIPPGWAWVDPLKESLAARSDLDGLLSTLADTLAGKGDDWEETLEQRAKELAKKQDLEKKYGITFTEDQAARTRAEEREVHNA